MQKPLEELQKLVSAISPNQAKAIVRFVENKLELLKICYDKSDSKSKTKIHELIKYQQLKCYLTGELYSSSKKKIELKDIIYTEKAIKGHLINGFPKEKDIYRVIEFYSLYFGGYKKIFRCFTKEFLRNRIQLDEVFLKDIFSENKINIEGDDILEIRGATIINSDFLNKIGKIEGITKAEFYAGIQSNNTQFYGVLHHFDIERQCFQEFKNTVIASFVGIADHKISAIVCGDGGSGKSTFLRRLAIELCKDENFDATILWLDGKNSINEFMDYGPKIIKEQPTTKFLLIIEDWHRTMNIVPKEQIIKFLMELNSCDNLRIVIGDRDENRKLYLEHFNGSIKDILRLTSVENEKIIGEIVKDYPDWKGTVDTLFKEYNIYQSSLFQILFIIQHIAFDNNEHIPVNSKELQRTFINIIESDLRIIGKRFPGITKALYYLSCIYTQYKLSISYDSFLNIADFFNENDGKIQLYFREINRDSQYHQTLRNYISISDNYWLNFNHDILTDLGMSHINFENIPPLSAIEKIDWIDTIISKGDEFSASLTLIILSYFEPNLLSNTERIERIRYFLNKEDTNPAITRTLINLKISGEELEWYAELFLKEEYYHFVPFWEYYRKNSKDIDNRHSKNGNRIEQIMNNFFNRTENYPLIFIEKIAGGFGISIYAKFVKMFIQTKKWYEFSGFFFYWCIYKCQDVNLQKELCETFLKQEESLNYNFSPLLLDEIFLHVEENLAKDFSGKLLKLKGLEKIHVNEFHAVMRYVDKNLCTSIINEILNKETWAELPPQFISYALSKVNKERSMIYANKILQSDFSKFNHNQWLVVRTCLDYGSKKVTNQIISENWIEKNKEKFPYLEIHYIKLKLENKI